MHDSSVVSPENFVIEKKTLARRFTPRPLRKWLDNKAHQRLLDQWAHHADPRVLDWDWGSIGFNRIAVVNLILRKFENPAYLEIGCASNSLFHSVPVSNKIGVDPGSGGTIRKTSDDFFQSNTAQFDVVFIDGLHTYEQVRRDVIHSMRCLKPGGWIALHDMLPRDWLEQHVPLIPAGAWSGDVWKVAFELAQSPGIDFKLLKLDHGVGVFRMTDPEASLRDLSSLLDDKQFAYYADHLDALPIVEWAQAQDWLKS
jgi:hypothetical protein